MPCLLHVAWLFRLVQGFSVAVYLNLGTTHPFCGSSKILALRNTQIFISFFTGFLNRCAYAPKTASEPPNSVPTLQTVDQPLCLLLLQRLQQQLQLHPRNTNALKHTTEFFESATGIFCTFAESSSSLPRLSASIVDSSRFTLHYRSGRLCLVQLNLPVLGTAVIFAERGEALSRAAFRVEIFSFCASISLFRTAFRAVTDCMDYRFYQTAGNKGHFTAQYLE